MSDNTNYDAQAMSNNPSPSYLNNPEISPEMQNWPLDVSGDYLALSDLVENEVNSYMTTMEQGSVLESLGDIGTPDLNNWTFDTPPPQMVFQPAIPHGEEVSRPSQFPTQVYSTQELFSTPPTRREVEQEIPVGDPNWYHVYYDEHDNQEYAANYDVVWPTNSVFHEMMSGQREPPPQYGYPNIYPASNEEYLDRTVRESDDLRKMFSMCLENEVRIGEELLGMSERMKELGEQLKYY